MMSTTPREQPGGLPCIKSLTFVEDNAGDGPAYPRVSERPPVRADDGVHEGAAVVLLHGQLAGLLQDVHEQGPPANISNTG